MMTSARAIRWMPCAHGTVCSVYHFSGDIPMTNPARDQRNEAIEGGVESLALPRKP